MTAAKRWSIVAACVIIYVAIFAAIANWSPVAPGGNHFQGLVLAIMGITGAVFGFGIVIVAFMDFSQWSFRQNVKAATRIGLEEIRNSQLEESNAPTNGFPVVPIATQISTTNDGPGRYRICGVNRQTKTDATLHVQADSAANAVVKAELDGIVVTSVTKL